MHPGVGRGLPAQGAQGAWWPPSAGERGWRRGHAPRIRLLEGVQEHTGPAQHVLQRVRRRALHKPLDPEIGSDCVK